MARSTEDHSALSLFAFAEELINAAKLIEEAGKRVRAAKVASVKVSHHAPIRHALATVPKFVADVDRKIMDAKLDQR